MKKVIIWSMVLAIFVGMIGGLNIESEAEEYDLIEDLLASGFVQDKENENLYVYREIEVDLEWAEFSYVYCSIDVVSGVSNMIYYSNVYCVNFEWNEGWYDFGIAQVVYDLNNLDNYELIASLNL